jgi:uncharacterized protein (DUF362 family)
MLDDFQVTVARTVPGYQKNSGARRAEWPTEAKASNALETLHRLFVYAGLDRKNVGSPEWNPIGACFGRNRTFVIKPNWVHHQNASGHGLECLITHSSVIEAVVEYVAMSEPSAILVGDAPVQACNFELMLRLSGLDEIFARLQRRGIPVQYRDFRLSTLPDGVWGSNRTTARSEMDYVRFNLGRASLLEPVSSEPSRFRVTMYDPGALERTHGPANHQYLIARELLEADVVINLPKLKTHKKAGITGALKNLVGANGHKSYLPHHRKGNAGEGGDCYEKADAVRSIAEDLLDRTNRSVVGLERKLFGRAAGVVMKTGRMLSKTFDVEGSWHGNDTVWRMVLDLQKILHYGQPDGTLSPNPAREIMNITDAIVGGQGEGPLSPEPASFGFLSLGRNAAACDWVHARLMGLDPDRIPLTREAFGLESSRLATFSPLQIRVQTDQQMLNVDEAARSFGCRVKAPAGWLGQCEAAAEMEHVAC